MDTAAPEMVGQNHSMEDDGNSNDSGEWTFDGRDPWSTIMESIARRFKETQQEARLINETRYLVMTPIDDESPVCIELIVGLSGALDFAPVLKMKHGESVSKYATVPFTYAEWVDFTSRLQLFSEQCFGENAANATTITAAAAAAAVSDEDVSHQDVHLGLIDDLVVRSEVVENQKYLTVSRCDVTIYLDKSIIREILNRNDMFCYKLDMLDKLNFSEYLKQIIHLAVEMSNQSNFENKNFDEIILNLCEVSNSERLYCMLECMHFLKHRVYAYLNSARHI